MYNSTKSRLEAAREILTDDGLSPEQNKALLRVFKNLINAQEEAIALSQIPEGRQCRESTALDAAQSIEDAIVALACAAGGTQTAFEYVGTEDGIALKVGRSEKSLVRLIDRLIRERKG